MTGTSTLPEVQAPAPPLEGVPTYVACLDVLGFKDLLVRHEGRLASVYRHVLNVSRLAGGLRFNMQVGDAATGKFLRDVLMGFRKLRGPIVFSDSIFILTQDDSQESLDEICVYSNMLFRNAIQANLPLRGAIAVGKTWHYPKDRVTMGHGLVAAHLLEQSLDSLGIVLDPSVPPTSAAGAPVEVLTKDGPRQLRPVLGGMQSHPEHLPMAVQVPAWQAKIKVLQQQAPIEAQRKYEGALVSAMFEGGAP